MKPFKRIGAMLLAVMMLLSCCIVSSFADAEEPAPEDIVEPKFTRGFNSEKFLSSNTYRYADDEIVRAIIILSGTPLAELDTRANKVTAKARIDAQHETLKQSMEKVDYELYFEYDSLLNGIAVDVAYGDLDAIAKMPGVSSVHIANHYDLPDDAVMMESVTDMTYLDWAYTNGYKGSGTVVAILDTGITPNHEAFKVYDGMLQSARITSASQFSAVNRSAQFLSKKICYAYDYADKDSNATDDSSGHGTHVSGIAAGYARDNLGAVTFRGSAPDAQIAAMKIFSSSSDGTNSSIYFAALEDAYELGVDVINMSIGSDNGFTYDEDLEAMSDNIYQTLENNGIVCCVSAGNNYSEADNVSTLTGDPTADYVDIGTLGSPSTYDGNLSVASVENMSYKAYVGIVDGQNFAFNDTSDNGSFFSLVAGRTYSYVMVPGYGESSDFAGLNVTGKIAVISRGSISFADKMANAAAAGAAAFLVYNNQPGTIGMAIDSFTIPGASVTQEAGALLAAGSGTVSFPTTEQTVMNDVGGQMSDFSSWGCTPQLTLKPLISGVGGNVNSAQYLTTNGYQLMSGTSMAAPNLTGTTATVTQYLNANFSSLSKKQRADMAEALMESTATLVVNTNGNYYSPRKQGSGLVNAKAAIDTTAYITNPIQNLGSDANKTGIFTLNFTVKNLVAETQSFTIDAANMYNTLYQEGGCWYNKLTSEYLGDHATVTSNFAGNVVTVPANGTADVTVTVTLDSEIKALFTEACPNGTFIEGFVKLVGTGETIHATYLGFYGDWESAPIFEPHDWREVVAAENWLYDHINEDTGNTYAEDGYTYLDVVDFDINTDVNVAYAGDLVESGGKLDGSNSSVEGYAGDNFYAFTDYNDKHIAISNNSNALVNGLVMIPFNIRNARNITMVVSNASTNAVYKTVKDEYIPKVAYDEGWKTYVGTEFYFLGKNGSSNIADGTVLDVNFYACTSDGTANDPLAGISAANLKTQGARYLQWSFQCTVDSTAPTISSYAVDNTSDSIYVTAVDTQYVAAILTVANGSVVDRVGFSEDAPNTAVTAKLSTGGNSSITVYAFDYAGNSVTQSVSTSLSSSCSHTYADFSTIPATCLEGGETIRRCSKCGKAETTAVNALGHNYVAEQTPATATSCAYTTYTCTRCGDTYTRYDDTFKVSFSVPDGVTAIASQNVYGFDSITLPTPAGTPSDTSYTYTFIGWVVKEYANKKGVAPENLYAAGSVFTPTQDTVFYALYRYTKRENQTSTVWKRATSTSQLANGQKIILAAPNANYAIGMDGSTTAITANAITKSSDGGYITDPGQYVCIFQINGTPTSSFTCVLSEITDLGSLSGYYLYNFSGTLYLYSSSTAWSVSGLTSAGAATVRTASGTAYYLRYASNKFSAQKNGTSNTMNIYYQTTETVQADVNYFTTLLDVAPEEPCEHNYEKDNDQSVAPTCTEPGKDVYVCANCGDSYEEPVAALGHDWIAGTPTPATCTEAGSTPYTCSRCDATKTEPIEAAGHDYVEHEAQAATCTEIGWDAYRTCSNCDYSEYVEIPALGHLHEEIPAVAPTCTEAGATAGDSCPRCGVVLSAPTEVPALGHDYIYTDNHDGETHTVTCGRCDYSEVENHTFTEGVCVCGAVESTEPEPLTLNINHTIDLAEDISIMFAVQKTLVADYDADEMYLTFSYNHYNGNEVGEAVTGTLLPSGDYNRNYWYFTLSGITAVEMGNDVTAQLHLFKDGTEYVVNDSYSVATYAYNQLNKTNIDDATKTVCANLLRYGAAAQNFKATRTDALPDAAMTDAQKAYLTDPDTVTFTNNYAALDDLAGASVTWVGKTFQMNTRVELMFVFNLEDFTGNREDLHLIVNYTDYTGTAKTYDVPNGRMLRYNPNDDTWYFCADCMRSADMRTVLSVAVYEGETRVSPTMQYSVESYACNKTGDILNLCKCLLAYSDACEIKFAR